MTTRYKLHLRANGKVFATKEIKDIYRAYEMFVSLWPGEVCDGHGDLIASWKKDGPLETYD